MGTIALQPGGRTTVTVSVPQPNFYSVRSARLFIKVGERDVYISTPDSASRDSIVFTIGLSNSQARRFASCSDCNWKTGTYRVRLFEGAFPLDPSFKDIDSGSVTVTGDLPCSDCGGEDPPGPPSPPPGEDDPFGTDNDGGDPLISAPDEPPAACLPPPFTASPPTVPTPCGGGSGGSGTVGFSNV